MATGEVRRTGDTFPLLFGALLLLLCGWVLSLPEFPSQDGPMHVYYAHIFGTLLRGAHAYEGAFRIRSLLPPYALHYYLLIALTSFVSTAMAEKLIVCLIFLVLGSGFRYLARACGESGGLAALFMLPLLLNWSLGMGFFNFCLSLGFAMWALGVWWRMRRGPSAGLAIAFLVLVATITLTHPVPLLLVLGVAGAELALRTLTRASLNRGGNGSLPAAPPLSAAAWAGLWGIYAAACCSLLYVAQFTDRHRIQNNTSGSALTHGDVLKGFLLLRPISMFAGSRIDNMLYRAALYLVVLAAIGAGLRAMAAFRGSRLEFLLRSPWLWMAVVFPVIVVSIPRDMNGSHYFADRLLLLTWFGALLAASAHALPPRRWCQGLAAAATLMTLGVLGMAQSRVRPVAVALAAARAHPFAEPAGTAGLLLGTPGSAALAGANGKVAFDPNLFAPAYAFAATDTVMLNSPWLDLPILPLATRQGLLNQMYSPEILDIPQSMGDTLMHADPGTRASVLGRAHFLIFGDPEQKRAMMAGMPDAGRWACVPMQGGMLCTR